HKKISIILNLCPIIFTNKPRLLYREEPFYDRYLIYNFMVMTIRYIQPKFYLLTVILFLVFAKNSYASHVVGGEISYRCLGGNQYAFTTQLYRDCQGINTAPNIPLTISSSSCSFNTTISLVRTNIEDISLLCSSQQSNCSGGSVQGYEIHT